MTPSPPGTDLSSVDFGPRRPPSIGWAVLSQLWWQLPLVLLMISPYGSNRGPGFLVLTGLRLLVAIFIVASLVRNLFLRRWWRMILPALALTIFIVNVIYVKGSVRHAREHVAAVARSIQAQCEKNGQCPAQPLSGEPWVHGLVIAAVPGTHLTWPMEYRRTEDGFVVTVRLMTDMHVSWGGGPGKAPHLIAPP